MTRAVTTEDRERWRRHSEMGLSLEPSVVLFLLDALEGAAVAAHATHGLLRAGIALGEGLKAALEREKGAAKEIETATEPEEAK
jgi:hypothetical protein